MARYKTILQNHYPYHITARCINRDWFSLPMNKVWDVFTEELYMTNITYNFQIHSFVLMNNHYHLIASTPDANLSQCMMRFSQKVSFRLTRMGNRINQTFAGRYFKSILTQPNYYLNTYKYNYRNPVEAGLCDKVQDYPYSTLNSLLGGTKLLVPIMHDDTLFPHTEGTLEWLNSKPDHSKIQSVKSALCRQKFHFPNEDRYNAGKMSKNDII